MEALIKPSSMTEREFGMVFAKLALQLRWVDADEIAIRSYFEVLRECALEDVQASALTLAREPGRKFFPGSAEWHTESEKARVERFRKAVAPPPADDNDQRLFVCLDCQDTGWMMDRTGEAWMCDGGSRCGRKQPHAPHTFTQACGCRASNVNFQRTKNFGAGR